jgi:ribonuclease HIII
MIPLDDPTLEAIKKGQKITMCQKCETYTPHVILWLNMKNYIEDQRRTWRNVEMKTAQHQRCIEEVEIRDGAMKTVIE